jgi:hypothetical protein
MTDIVEISERVVIQEVGARGIKGTQILKGSGQPSSSTGIAGDFYLDTIYYYLYGPKATDTAWDYNSYISLQGRDGRSFLTGSGVPSAQLGNYFDTYLDLLTGNLYAKEVGGWTQISNIINQNTFSFTYEQQYAAHGGNPSNGGDGGWIINHNLGYNPAVTVMDYSKNTIECDIEYVNSNTVILTFNNAVSGHAYLS